MTLAHDFVDRILSQVLGGRSVQPPYPLYCALYDYVQEIHELDPAAPDEAVTESVANFVACIPKPYLRSPEEFSAEIKRALNAPTIPVHDVLPNLGHAIIEAGGPLLRTKLKNQLLKNEAIASGINPVMRYGANIIPADEYDGTPREIIDIYLRDTPLRQLFLAGVPFTIPRKTWASHGIILAPPNHGKTQLLGSLIAGFLSEPDPVGCFVLDPHGDLYSNLAVRVRPDRLVCLDPDTHPPPLNFLDFGNSTEAQTLQTFSYLMSALSGGLTDKQGAIVPYMLKLLRKIKAADGNTSLETLSRLVSERPKKWTDSQFAEHINSLDPIDRAFFQNQFFHSSMEVTKHAIAWKLYSALSSDAFRQMFSAPTNSVDFDAAIAERKIVLVKGGRKSLGDDGMRVFLQFIIAQFFAAGLRRERIAPDKRHVCIMFVDEGSYVLNSPIIAQILVELRKYGCGFVAATQVFEQIGQEIKAAILGATAIKVSGPVSFSDANLLAREMYTTPDIIRSMKAREGESADWAFYVSGMTDKAVKVTVPYGALEAMPKRAEAAVATTASGLPAPTKAVAVVSDPASIPQTHDAPTEAEASHDKERVSAETDPPIVTPVVDDAIHTTPVERWGKR